MKPSGALTRRVPLKPGTGLRPSGKRMRQGRSTTTPTKAEAAHIVAVKEGPCLACLIWTDNRYHGCDAHHLLSGGRRIGHMSVIGLCPYHHRGVPLAGMSKRMALHQFGPSLMDGSRPFHEAFGDDAALTRLQSNVLGRDE